MWDRDFTFVKDRKKCMAILDVSKELGLEMGGGFMGRLCACLEKLKIY